MTSGKISVGWEIAKFLIPAAQKGYEEAMMLQCKLANPTWADVELKDFKMKGLGGGMSGNVPIKCSAAGRSGSLAVKNNANQDDEEDSLVNAAYRQRSRAGIVPTVFCLGNPDAPGIEI